MSKTVRILSFDGGGIRGYFSSTFMNRFCSSARIDPAKIYESFDMIAGTSIGGIQTLGYGFGLSPAQLLQFFRDQGANIFSYSSLLPLSAYKFNVIMGLPTYPSTFYAQDPLREALTSVFGNNLLLRDLPGKVIITAWDASDDVSQILSNITGFEPFLSGSGTNVIDAGMATGAAPLYFPPLTSSSGNQLIDGGVFQNSPTMIAYSVAKKMYPTANRFCVLSVGTGQSYNEFIPSSDWAKQIDPEFYQDFAQEWEALQGRLLEKYPHHGHLIAHPLGSIAPNNVQYLFYLLDNVLIPGPAELADKMMNFISQDLYDDIFYYRFQYNFKKDEDSSMDNASPEHLQFLADKANETYDADRLKIQNFIEHFIAG